MSLSGNLIASLLQALAQRRSIKSEKLNENLLFGSIAKLRGKRFYCEVLKPILLLTAQLFNCSPGSNCIGRIGRQL